MRSLSEAALKAPTVGSDTKIKNNLKFRHPRAALKALQLVAYMDESLRIETGSEIETRGSIPYRLMDVSVP